MNRRDVVLLVQPAHVLGVALGLDVTAIVEEELLHVARVLLLSRGDAGEGERLCQAAFHDIDDRRRERGTRCA